MGDYGIRVAKAGYDALTDSDQNMAFTSKRYSDKVLHGVVLSVAMSGTSATVSYTHGLGYAPQCWIFDSSKSNSPIPNWWSTTGQPDFSADATINSSTITITWNATGSITATKTAIILILEKAI